MLLSDLQCVLLPVAQGVGPLGFKGRKVTEISTCNGVSGDGKGGDGVARGECK